MKTLSSAANTWHIISCEHRLHRRGVCAATHSNPKLLNDTVIWPRKVALNKYYANHQSALLDTLILLSTISPVFYRLLRFFGCEYFQTTGIGL